MDSFTERKFDDGWKNATLANNFIFYKVMKHHPEECKHLIEMLLNVQIESIEMHNEEVIDIDCDSKSIRLDVYVTDDKRMYDIELQVANTNELPERSRYYSALMSLDTLKIGQKYKQLRDGHVIFICMKDIFGDRLPVYSFENICLENKKIKLNDRDYKHFFIAPTCAKILKNPELRAFFELLTSNNPSNEFTSNLKQFVDDAKHNMQWRYEYMTWERIQAYARDEGEQKGRTEKAIEDAIKIIKKYNATPEEAANDMDAPLDKVLEKLNEINTLKTQTGEIK